MPWIDILRDAGVVVGLLGGLIGVITVLVRMQNNLIRSWIKGGLNEVVTPLLTNGEKSVANYAHDASEAAEAAREAAEAARDAAYQAKTAAIDAKNAALSVQSAVKQLTEPAQ